MLKNHPTVSDKLKSRAARRDIGIPDELLKHLQEFKKNVSAEYVLCNRAGRPMTESEYRKMWDYVERRRTGVHTYKRYDKDGNMTIHTFVAEKGQINKRNKIVYTIDFDVTPHILRHTYISRLILSGIDIKTVQKLAGHEKAQMTLDIYTHLLGDDKAATEKARNAINNWK